MSAFIASIIFSCSLLQSAISDSYITVREKQYQNEDIICDPKDDTCTVKCDTDFGCEGAIINCAADQQCDISCGGPGDYSCWNTLINCTDSTVCDLTCNATLACWGLTIDAPENGTVNIVCNNNEILDNVCSGITVNGGVDSINCEGTGTCWQSTFNGTGSIDLCYGIDACLEAILPQPPMDIDYELVCDGERACKYTEVLCPAKANCTIICDGTDACDGTIVTPPDDEELLVCKDGSVATPAVIDCEEIDVILVIDEGSGDSDSDGTGAGALGALLVIFMIVVCAWLVVSYGIVYKQEHDENQNVEEVYELNQDRK